METGIEEKRGGGGNSENRGEALDRTAAIRLLMQQILNKKKKTLR